MRTSVKQEKVSSAEGITDAETETEARKSGRKVKRQTCDAAYEGLTSITSSREISSYVMASIQFSRVEQTFRTEHEARL